MLAGKLSGCRVMVSLRALSAASSALARRRWLGTERKTLSGRPALATAVAFAAACAAAVAAFSCSATFEGRRIVPVEGT